MTPPAQLHHATSSSAGSNSEDGSDHDHSPGAAGVATADTDSSQPPKRKRRRQQRATYHIRKDEIQELQSRAENLELELKALKFQTLVANVGGGGTSAGATASDVPNAPMATLPATAETPTIAKSKMTQQLLKDAVRSQQFALAGLQALLSNYSSLQDTSPLHMGIRLSRDFDERRATLAAARTSMLSRARRFISERSAGLDPLRAFAEQERFEDLHGAYCVTNFDVLPLPTSATSEFGVKSAHDMFCYLMRNVEITFSEWVGPITIRENEESTDAQCSQHRLVAYCPFLPLAHVETNMVAFSDYCSEEDVGILVAEAVAEDELHPYKPEERVRWDSSGVYLFFKHENTVVLTRWSFSKMYTSALFRNAREKRLVRTSLGMWNEKLLEAIHDAAALAAGEPSQPMIIQPYHSCG